MRDSCGDQSKEQKQGLPAAKNHMQAVTLQVVREWFLAIQNQKKVKSTSLKAH